MCVKILIENDVDEYMCMKLLQMKKDNRIAAGSWGESKQRVNIMLTPTAVEKVDHVAEELQLTRSEILERLIRSPCLESEILKEIESEPI